MTTPITFVVAGVEKSQIATRGGVAPDPEGPYGILKTAVQVGSVRAGGDAVRVEAEDGDIVVLKIDNGPELVLSPDSARKLLLAQSGLKRTSDEPQRGGEPAKGEWPGEIPVGATMRWRGMEDGATSRGTERGAFGDVILSAFNVFKPRAAEMTALALASAVDGLVDAGVYELAAGRQLASPKDFGTKVPAIPPPTTDGPLLVFIHGTASSTSGSFGKLWLHHPALVSRMFRKYEDRVYALEHPTLLVSPIENALALANALPAGARVHMVTHSRGGLVAEVLAHVCAQPDGDGDADGEFEGDPFKEHREQLAALRAVVRRQGITVERIVRVACPSRGTLLASKRLDAYFSVFRWALSLAKLPVVPQLVSFLAAVARERTDPEALPGLQAQMPESSFVRWLHAIKEPMVGDLRVVAGDLDGDSIGSWLMTLASDMFYWTDNDLVVNTRNMYGGAPRKGGAKFFLDRGGEVTHFNYFGNKRTAEAIIDGLDDAATGFAPIGPLSWAGESPSGDRAAVTVRGASADKPAVFLLPGILGSNLKVDGKRIWLGPRLLFGLERLRLAAGDGVMQDGPVESVYGDLVRYLSSTHEVIEFGYDWRKPMQDSARELAARIDQALDERRQSGQPVRILAHSMGGLVARLVQQVAPATWKRCMEQEGARFVMLGTPNRGSWAPMQVLTGDDTFGNGLVALGAPFRDREARMMMAQFPGFLQLQALAPPLDRAEEWKRLAEEDLRRVRENNWWHDTGVQRAEYAWGIPAQGVLDEAVQLRSELDQQQDAALDPWKSKMALVLGHADFTPDGYEMGPEGFAYVGSAEPGDGRVTIDRAVIDGVRTWKLDCVHGSLPSHRGSFEAYRELLERGTTQGLEPYAPARGAITASVARARVRPSRTPAGAQPPQSGQDVFKARTASFAGGGPAASLQVALMHGDLKFVGQPLMLGHYRSLRLTGAEAVIDRLLDGQLTQRLRSGEYPKDPGSRLRLRNLQPDPQNPWRIPRPESVIVVGLGAEGDLQGEELIEAARLGALSAADDQAEHRQGSASFELSATLIGSGGIGITPGQAAQLVAEGVRQANVEIARDGDGRRPRVSRLLLIELYLDRAAEALQALRAQADVLPGRFVVESAIAKGMGGLVRPLDGGYRGANYDFITITQRMDDRGDRELAYTVDTKRARSEVSARAVQGRLLEALITRQSNERFPEDLGRAIFRLLVPVGIRAFLTNASDVLLEVEPATAAIPWELFEADDMRRGLPWGVRSKVVRKLRTTNFNQKVDDATREASVLVIGEPRCGPKYPRLPGAREEAKAVAARLSQGDRPVRVVTHISGDDGSPGPDAVTVTRALLAGSWRIVHLSGHGEPPLDRGPGLPKDPRGVVLSDDSFLGPREMAPEPVPQLVFLNCCFGARWDVTAQGSLAPYNRPQFAANVAEQLINHGVRCVIAAGWAVDDAAAKTFAETFYDALMRGERFIDAVGAARQGCYVRHPESSTWAAYQCYGDPEWRLFERTGDVAMALSLSERAAISSPRALELALEALEVRRQYHGRKRQPTADALRILEDGFRQWLGIGSVRERFGRAWAAVDEPARAIEHYRAALECEDGTASLRTTEQLANLIARLAWEALPQTLPPQATPKEPVEPVAEALAQVQEAIGLLDRLVLVQRTMERLSLLGSAYKRRAQIERAAGMDESKSVRKANACYKEAYDLARKQGNQGLFYPAMNLLAAQLALSAGRRGAKAPDRRITNEVRKALDAKRSDPDFWSVVAETELQVYEAVTELKLAARAKQVEAERENLNKRLNVPRNWKSVRDTEMFALEGYAKKATGAEREALQRLMDQLRRFAERPDPDD